jgi:trehalose synthase-fused probable maltokinase
MAESAGPYFASLRVLGQRTAEMHLALAVDADSADFRPERFTPFARRAFFQSVRGLTRRSFQNLREHLDAIPSELRREAGELVELEAEIVGRVRAILERHLASYRIRTHGDFHLGQVLRAGNDFVVIDFEGEPALPLGERRIKRSPLRDVAGMLRSFHYAARVALVERIARRIRLPEGSEGPLHAWARAWYVWSGGAYLAAYLARARTAPILAEADDAEIAALLNVHRLEKAIYELDYELNMRPSWVGVPLAGIAQILGETLGLQAAARRASAAPAAKEKEKR